MIKLKEEFKKGGNTFKCYYRDEDMAIYTIDWYYGKRTAEIFKIKVVQKDKFRNEPFEKYPSNEDFGLWAWSCTTQGSLEKKMREEFPGKPIPKILADTL